MAKVEIIDMITYRETDDDGNIIESVIDPMPPPPSELQKDHSGMAWHPILEKWVPEADINKRMIVDESEIFPSDTGDDEDVDEGEGEGEGEGQVKGEGPASTASTAEPAAQSDGQETFTFKIGIDPKQYAKRFGVDVPDDSADEGLTDDKG